MRGLRILTLAVQPGVAESLPHVNGSLCALQHTIGDQSPRQSFPPWDPIFAQLRVGPARAASAGPPFSQPTQCTAAHQALLRGTGPASRSYSSSGVVSPARICSQFIRRTGICAWMNRRATRCFRSLADCLAQQQVADDDRDRPSTSRRADRSTNELGFCLTNWIASPQPLPGLDELLCSSVSSGSSYCCLLVLG